MLVCLFPFRRAGTRPHWHREFFPRRSPGSQRRADDRRGPKTSRANQALSPRDEPRDLKEWMAWPESAPRRTKHISNAPSTQWQACGGMPESIAGILRWFLLRRPPTVHTSGGGVRYLNRASAGHSLNVRDIRSAVHRHGFSCVSCFEQRERSVSTFSPKSPDLNLRNKSPRYFVSAAAM